MYFRRGDIVRLLNENFLDQFYNNDGQRALNMIDTTGHPAIVLAGSESWDILQENIYIVLKGQSLRRDSLNYNDFCTNIENGIATFVEIPGENAITYIFSGELYTVDMNIIDEQTPRIEPWKPWNNRTQLRSTNNDLIALTLCTIISQEELLNNNPIYNYIIKSTFSEAIDSVNINNYAREDILRSFPIIRSIAKIQNQYIHPKTNEVTNRYWDNRPEYANIDEDTLKLKLSTLISVINQEFTSLADNALINNNSAEEQMIYEGLVPIYERSESHYLCSQNDREF